MTIYILIGVLILIFFLLMAVKGLENREKPQDSALKQRAIFNLNEQLTYTRLQEILPQHIILAHVSFDALLTTKFAHTRRKYQGLVADFVVLDQQHQVLAIIEIADQSYVNRLQQKHYQDSLLELAGYRVLRYSAIPTEQELREDLIPDLFARATPRTATPVTMPQAAERAIKYNVLAVKSS